MKLGAVIIASFLLLSYITSCHQDNSQKNVIQFTNEFFQQYVPELPLARLLTKDDLPQHQQQFFEENKSQLQLLADLNNNGIPEYIVSGVSEQYLRDKIKKPYFIAIFEQQESGVKRLFFQQVFVPPVTFHLSKKGDRLRVVVSFAFYSDYGAAIYFDQGKYHLEKW